MGNQSKAQFKIDTSRGAAECRSSVWVTGADKNSIKTEYGKNALKTTHLCKKQLKSTVF